VKSLNVIHLNGLRAVEATARRGSLLAAAEELGVSPSAVSQQIARTEKQIGRTIFERTRAGLAPTEFGLLFTARLASGFRELEQAMALTNEDASNTLVASVAPAFAARWLVPRLSRLYARHPEVILRIDATPRVIDLGRSDIDLAIRMGDGRWPGAKTELLLPQEIFPVCAPAIGARLKKIDDLASQWAIHDESSGVTWERWFTAIGRRPVATLPGASFTDPILCLEAAIAGQGVMLGWSLLVSEALASGQLVAPFGVRGWRDLGYYFAAAKGRRPSRKILAFKRWLFEEAAKFSAEKASA
jgi:LysR family transcriptional regulator, glycine cleavage system transcriptional activator